MIFFLIDSAVDFAAGLNRLNLDPLSVEIAIKDVFE